MQHARELKKQRTPPVQVELQGRGDQQVLGPSPLAVGGHPGLRCSFVFSGTSLGLPDGILKLPPDLWARVFTLLEPTPSLNTDHWRAAQASFWQIPLVCKTFDQIILQHKIGRHVCIQTEFIPYSVIPSLLAWLEAKCDTIETLQTSHYWSVQSEECFTALCPSRVLTSVIATPSGVASLEILARFQTLQSCHLSCPLSGHLDLAPLQGLAQLTSLKLVGGAFANLAARCLTHLSLSCAGVSCTTGCGLCSTLIKLTMEQSRLDNVGSEGLLACTALQGLHISRDCTFRANKKRDLLHATSSTTPLSLDMSALAALRRVEFAGLRSNSSAALLGICKLPSLNHLHMHVSTDFAVGSEFEHLTKVTYLSIRITGVSKRLKLRFDWQALKALQCLHLDGCLDADEDLLRLAQLQRLQHVNLENLRPANDTSGALLAQLEQSLGHSKFCRYPEFLNRYTSPGWFCTKPYSGS